jgi:hypothetical protein
MGKIGVSSCDGSTRFFKAQPPTTQRLVPYTTFCGVGPTATPALHLGCMVVLRPRNSGRPRKLDTRSGMGVIARQMLYRRVLDNVMGIFLTGLPEIAYGWSPGKCAW